MLADVPDGWQIVHNGKAIQKIFIFDDFNQAFSFMSKAKNSIDQLNHHPEWLNIYNKVDVTLTTHDIGGLSELDYQLAHAMDELAKT